MGTHATIEWDMALGIVADRVDGDWQDHEVTDLGVMMPNPKGPGYAPINVLEGVNVRSPDVQRLLANICAAIDLSVWEHNAEFVWLNESEDYERDWRDDYRLTAGQAGRGL
jgi:hypothetical protein